MSDWDFLGPMGCGYFHQAQLKRGRLENKNPNDSSKIIHNNLCRIPTSFFIQGHLLEVDLKLWTNERFQ